eukprot:4483858-Lingulodinium_polyedra.AAC.1
MAREWEPLGERPLRPRATRTWAATVATVQRPTCAQSAGILWMRRARASPCTSGRGVDICCI